MDMQKEREAFLYELDGHGYSFTHNHWDNENNRFHNDQLNMVWEMWQAAKASAVPDDYVLVEKSKIHTWYQDGDEPENIANSADDIECLGDVLDGDEIMEVNVYESAHISKKTVFGVWKSNSPTNIESNFVLVNTYEEAEEILAANQAMIKEAQED